MRVARTLWRKAILIALVIVIIIYVLLVAGCAIYVEGTAEDVTTTIVIACDSLSEVLSEGTDIVMNKEPQQCPE